eukprot:1141808-Pelagomonas_calceolata.AAC.2
MRTHAQKVAHLVASHMALVVSLPVCTHLQAEPVGHEDRGLRVQKHGILELHQLLHSTGGGHTRAQAWIPGCPTRTWIMQELDSKMCCMRASSCSGKSFGTIQSNVAFPTGNLTSLDDTNYRTPKWKSESWRPIPITQRPNITFGKTDNIKHRPLQGYRSRGTHSGASTHIGGHQPAPHTGPMLSYWWAPLVGTSPHRTLN